VSKEVDANSKEAKEALKEKETASSISTPKSGGLPTAGLSGL